MLAGTGGELEDSSSLGFTGSQLVVGTGVTIQTNGNAAFAGIVTVGGDLNVTGDYSVDEISARNLTLTGIATIPTLGVTGIATAETLQVGNLGLSVLGITTFTGNADFNGDLDVDGATTLDGLTVAEPAAFSDNVTISESQQQVRILVDLRD